MDRVETICRVLRDLGVFLLGLAAIALTVDYLFIRPDPMREMQKIFNQSFTESLQQKFRHPDAGRPTDNRSEAPPFTNVLSVEYDR